MVSLLQGQRTLNWLMAKSVAKTQSTVTQEKIVFTVRIAEYENKLPKQVTEFSFLAIQNFASMQIAAGDNALSRAE